MLMSGVLGDKYVYVAVLKACSMASALEQGRLSHSQMTKSGLQLDLAVGNILLDMYAKSGSLEEALDVFYTWPSRNVVSWNAMIAGYAQHGEGFSAVKCFENMSQSGVKPNNVTFSSILKACGIIQAIEKGRCMHGSIIQNGLQNDVFVGSGLVDMYVKCECLEEARYILDKLPSKNAVHWGAMIAGYAQHGEELAALNCFESMQNEGIKPDKLTYPSILKACAGIGAIERGRHIHKQIRKDGLQHDAYVGSILVDMYAKCGNLEEACEIFQSMMKRDMVLWAAMVSGYAQSDNVNLAGQCLEQMQQEGIFPCRVMFTSILAACSRAGLVNEGLKYFRLMTENYDIMPDDSHYNCIVDLFGRAGYLNQAVNLLQSNRCNIVGWTSLLSACRTYGIVDLGRHCFDRVVHLDSHFSGGYVLMSGIYSDAFMWQSAAEIEERRQRAGAWKKPGKAWIEINDKVNEFMVGDKGHPQSREISETLKRLNKEVKKQGYTPKLDLVLQKMSDEEKEETLCGHCERLAIAFGLLNTHPGTTIRITKNLRVCSDCHSVTKLISQIEMRDIIIQDAYRLHHFRDGICSCGDYY